MRTCKDVGPLLDGYHDRELGSIEHWRVQRHLASCRACRQDLASLETVGGFVRAAVAGAGATDHWSAIEARLPAARPAAAEARRVPGGQTLWRPGLVVATAAAAAVALLYPDPDLGPSGVVRSIYAPERAVMVLEAERSDDPTIIWLMDEQSSPIREVSTRVGI